MKGREQLIEWLRGEIVGPSRFLGSSTSIEFQEKVWSDTDANRSGPITWRPSPDSELEEVVYYQREAPHRKYGVGLLHPFGSIAAEEIAAASSDTLGAEAESVEEGEGKEEEDVGESTGGDGDVAEPADEFEVTSPDLRKPSTIGISFCVHLPELSQLLVSIPTSHRFAWQAEGSPEFPVNGRYEACVRRWKDAEGVEKSAPLWRRRVGVLPDTVIRISAADFFSGTVTRRDVVIPDESPICLRIEAFSRRLLNRTNVYLVTLVLRNCTRLGEQSDPLECILYQSYFEVRVSEGSFEKYPESERPFSELDSDEQSLALLYRDSATWAIGHGCAAAWDTEPGHVPSVLYADVMPGVQTPSVTPDIKDSAGRVIRLSMRELANLPDAEGGPAWGSLVNLATEYSNWINERQRESESDSFPRDLRTVAQGHLAAARRCLARIERGIEILRSDPMARKAFKLANLAMLLQQISSKQLGTRPLSWVPAADMVRPAGPHQSPWKIYELQEERSDLGKWRPFQVGFLLMSLEGVIDGTSPDRDIVDLIWFPTGGGKTEAYLAVVAFYVFHQRLLMPREESGLQRDGTNVLMRYTLRMLTTQQFQRAASLICAMEFLRRNPVFHSLGQIPGRRLSLGLWLGGGGSPNTKRQAISDFEAFRAEKLRGNPLVLTECPWCRAEIGRFDGTRPRTIPDRRWKTLRVRGVTVDSTEGPLLHCPDAQCPFGAEQKEAWLPVEVIDERIYKFPPTFVIATADKFAMISFRPEAGCLFGRTRTKDTVNQTHMPPGLIVQDELHLISGPLGTIYGLYEAIFERLCSYENAGRTIKPKLIASTATIRGAAQQTMALYAREQVQLFPSPGLAMADSYFGQYSRGEDGRLSPGRMYVGIHANDYGSILTAEVRCFSSVLFRPTFLDPSQRDPWWSLLIFYNSIRELSGASTLFTSDIRSRLRFLFNRENIPKEDRRNLRIVEELTSRLSQAEIVEMMDRLSRRYEPVDNQALDACLASNIIEVGVDIDRLSLMGVVGQPKTTAQYIQITGRVGRRWWERPGLILTIYNPSKSRDRSHFEQFHTYHRRLYERVEPTSATPFALSAIQRALPGALIAWSRQYSNAEVWEFTAYEDSLDDGYELVQERCRKVQNPDDQRRSLEELESVLKELKRKWKQNPQEWEEFPPAVSGEYLMLWPGQFATPVQRQNGVTVPMSMRQVDKSGELTITQAYSAPGSSRA